MVEWCIDYDEDPRLLLRTAAAWYTLVEPSALYAPTFHHGDFATMHICHAVVELLTEDGGAASAPYNAVCERVVEKVRASTRGRLPENLASPDGVKTLIAKNAAVLLAQVCAAPRAGARARARLGRQSRAHGATGGRHTACARAQIGGSPAPATAAGATVWGLPVSRTPRLHGQPPRSPGGGQRPRRAARPPASSAARLREDPGGGGGLRVAGRGALARRSARSAPARARPRTRGLAASQPADARRARAARSCSCCGCRLDASAPLAPPAPPLRSTGWMTRR